MITVTNKHVRGTWPPVSTPEAGTYLCSRCGARKAFKKAPPADLFCRDCRSVLAYGADAPASAATSESDEPEPKEMS